MPARSPKGSTSRPQSMASRQKIQKKPSEELIAEFKSVLKITPMTIRHLHSMGFTTIGSLADIGNTAESLNGIFKKYLFQKFPGKKPFNYTIACRRILWAARADPSERARHPEKYECKSWSNKAFNSSTVLLT
jgi:hypothetical protein